MQEREEHRTEEEQTEGRAGIEPQPGTAEPMDASAYAASSSESGGLYTEEGATRGDREGDPVAEEEEEEGERPEDRPGVGDVFRSGS